MSIRQTAVINGLLAENLGKNDLIRHAEAKSRNADSRANDAEHDADMAQIKLSKAKIEIAQLQAEVDKYKKLLSRPMQEIAEISGDFKKTYDMQQQLLAEWIMGQKAYRETAMQLGMALNMAPEQVQKVAAPNYTAVLENRTKFGNNANDGTPTLAAHAETILAIRKKNGKA
jgi:hypothetical protein